MLLRIVLVWGGVGGFAGIYSPAFPKTGARARCVAFQGVNSKKKENAEEKGARGKGGVGGGGIAGSRGLPS